MATLIDDCGRWQVVWMDPSAVLAHPSDTPARPILSWEDSLDQHLSALLVEPSEAWGARWEAAAGVAVAHLLALSAGERVIVSDGPLARMFRLALDALLPSGLPKKGLALAGPTLASQVGDIFLVPQHPQTGEIWRSGTDAAVALPMDVWAYLAFNDNRRLLPAAGGLPAGVYRDDPPPSMPFGSFRPDGRLFLHTLARLPEVRQPWLRAIYDQVEDGHGLARPF
ncbi:hypothetical protein ACIBG8_12410 [Nonomuraea sp. NPDC050556]|uniref:hypothetical protein n=1 Tax=Nonomuraea sp. NPDC050556 TaxID=3364369 RepID=UPI00379E1A3B